MKLDTKIAGRLRVVAIKPDGTERVLADWFDNLILNTGLDRIGASLNAITYARVGSGSTPPEVTDLNLQSPVASTTTVQGAVLFGNTSSAPYYGWIRKTFRFNTGVAAGVLSEIGIGWGTSSGQLFSRALIKNSSGNPISITVLSNEVLDVTYELRLYAPTDDVPYTVTIGGIEHTGVVRASRASDYDWQPSAVFGTSYQPQVTAHSGSIGTILQSPSGTFASGSVVLAPYTAGNYYRDFTATFDLNVANFGAGGVRAFHSRTAETGSFQFSVSPALLKDANKIMSITLRMSWSRYTPT